jgi:uncharacterized membrane protein
MFSNVRRYFATVPALSSLAGVCALVLMFGCAVEEEDVGAYNCNGKVSQHSYASFGRTFLQQNCLSCHVEPKAIQPLGADEAPASARLAPTHGASHDVAGYDFSTLADVRKHRARIYARAAGANRSMPPGPDDPSDEARAALADWLACGAEFAP